MERSGKPSVVDVSLLVLLVKHGTLVALAAFIAASCGAAVGFTMSKYIAFRDRSPISVEQLGRFAFVAVVTATHDISLMDQYDSKRLVLHEGRLHVYD